MVVISDQERVLGCTKFRKLLGKGLCTGKWVTPAIARGLFAA